MIAALLICGIYAVAFWLVFFKFKWIKFSIVWGVVSGCSGAVQRRWRHECCSAP